MLKALIIAASVATVPVFAMGCGGGDPATEGDAAGNKSPMDQLKAIPEDLGKEVDSIMQPLTDIDAVVDGITNLPQKLGLDAKQLKVMVKGAFDGGEINIEGKVKPEQKAEVEELLKKAKGIPEGLKAIPDKVAAFLPKLGAALAKVPALGAAASASLTATANNPFGNADAKAKAKADLADLEKIKTDISAKIDEIKKKVTELPAKATTAGAKLTASFAS